MVFFAFFLKFHNIYNKKEYFWESMSSEPYYLQISCGGQVAPFLVSSVGFKGDIYLFSIQRVGGMIASEHDVSLRYGGILSLELAMEAFFQVCGEDQPLFQDIFYFTIPLDTRKLLGEPLARDLEQRVSLHNKRFKHLSS